MRDRCDTTPDELTGAREVGCINSSARPHFPNFCHATTPTDRPSSCGSGGARARRRQPSNLSISTDIGHRPTSLSSSSSASHCSRPAIVGGVAGGYDGLATKRSAT